jgi:hypothetical protein
MPAKRILAAAAGCLILAVTGVAAQNGPPDQGAAPLGSNPNMGDGTGAGPAGSIGDPNGTGPGAAAPAPGPGLTSFNRSAPVAPPLSRSDGIVLKACLGVPRDSMTALAKCRALMARRPDLFKE